VYAALSMLSKSKNIKLTLKNFYYDDTGLVPIITGELSGDYCVEFNLPDNIFSDNNPYYSNEEHHDDWPIDKRILIRVAKLIFNYCKGDTLVSSVTANSHATISSIHYGNTICDIVDVRVDAVKDRIDTLESTNKDLQEKVDRLTDINKVLEYELFDLKSKLAGKGLID
jgi:hypothetical protein